MTAKFERGQIVKTTGRGRTATWPGWEFVVCAVRPNGNVVCMSEEFRPDEVEFTGKWADENHPALVNSDLWWEDVSKRK